MAEQLKVIRNNEKTNTRNNGNEEVTTIVFRVPEIDELEHSVLVHGEVTVAIVDAQIKTEVQRLKDRAVVTQNVKDILKVSPIESFVEVN